MKVSAFMVLLSVVLAGCRSGEEQANEDALKARNAQFSEMEKKGSGAPPSAQGTVGKKETAPGQKSAPGTASGG